MSGRFHALMFNELTCGLSRADRFVALSEREAITRGLTEVAHQELGQTNMRLTATIDQIHGLVDHSPHLGSGEVVMEIQKLLAALLDRPTGKEGIEDLSSTDDA